MTEPSSETPDPPPTCRTVAEIVTGYALILGLIGLLFGASGGIDIRMPWPLLGGIAALGALFAGLALRGRRRA